MDGKIVEKNTVDKMNQILKYIKANYLLPLDVHLMVEDHWFPGNLELSLLAVLSRRPFPPPPLPLLSHRSKELSQISCVCSNILSMK